MPYITDALPNNFDKEPRLLLAQRIALRFWAYLTPNTAVEFDKYVNRSYLTVMHLSLLSVLQSIKKDKDICSKIRLNKILLNEFILALLRFVE